MHRNPSVMQHKFSQVPAASIPRSTFNRSHGYKTAFNAGYLIPFYLDEALPADTTTVRLTGFARLATPIFPIMDNLYMDTHFFSVPIRLIWDNWQRFNGEQPNPGDSTDFVVPTITGTFTENSLEDYMGLPVGHAVYCSALYHRAINLIWNEFFRDQNLQDRVPENKGDGPDNPADYTLLRRGKRHDYFTSCLPWPQKGPGVTIPLGGNAPVLGIGASTNVWPAGSSTGFYETGQSAATATGANFKTINSAAGPDGTFLVRQDPNNPGFPAIFADLSQATAATINSLRQAFQIQKIYERDARGGTRYIELLKSHFGVTSPDARLQRPEFLGGGSSPVNISPIPQTSASGAYAESPQGNLAAMGTVVLHNHGFTSSFTEHCILVGFVSVRADLTYQQGLDRMFKRSTRFDFYWPALQAIGEQAVLLGEIYHQGNGSDATVFGYQERHAEYRYKNSRITGRLRSSSSASLDAWHLSQDFATAPVLNASFIEENPPVDRVIAVNTEPHFIFDGYFKQISARPMPVYGVPGLIDHF